MRGLYRSLRVLSFAVIVLMLGAIGYAFVMSLLNWSEIGV